MPHPRIPIRHNSGLIVTPNKDFFLTPPNANSPFENIYPPNALQVCSNLHHIIPGQLTKRRGIECFLIGDAGLFVDSAMMLSFFINSDGNYYLVAIDGAGKLIYKDINANNPEWISLGVEFDNTVQYRHKSSYYDDNLYIVNGVDQFKRFTGEEVEDVRIVRPLEQMDIDFIGDIETSISSSSAMFNSVGSGIWQYKYVFGIDDELTNPSPANTVSTDFSNNINTLTYQYFGFMFVKSINLTIPASSNADVNTRKVYRRYKEYSDLPFSPYEEIADVAGYQESTFTDKHESLGNALEIDNDVPPIARLVETADNNMFLANITNDNVLNQPDVSTLYPNFSWDFDARVLIKVINTSNKVYTDDIVEIKVTRYNTGINIYLPNIYYNDNWYRGLIFLDDDGITPLPQQFQSSSYFITSFAVRVPELKPGINYFYVAYRYNHNDSNNYNDVTGFSKKWKGVKSSHLFYYGMNDYNEGYINQWKFQDKKRRWNEGPENALESLNTLYATASTSTILFGPEFYQQLQSNAPSVTHYLDFVIKLINRNDFGDVCWKSVNPLTEFPVKSSWYFKYQFSGDYRTTSPVTRHILFTFSNGGDNDFVLRWNSSTLKFESHMETPVGSNATFNGTTAFNIANGSWWTIGVIIDTDNNTVSFYAKEDGVVSGQIDVVSSTAGSIIGPLPVSETSFLTIGAASYWYTSYDVMPGFYKVFVADNYAYSLEEFDSVARNIIPLNDYTSGRADDEVDVYDEERPKPGRIRWSKDGKPRIYPADYYDDILTSYGQSITGLKRHRKQLLAFTPNQIAFLPLEGDERTWNTVDTLSDDYAGIGLVAPESLFEHEFGVGGLSSKGIFLYGNDIGMKFIKGLKEVFRPMSAMNKSATEMEYNTNTGQLFVQTFVYLGTSPETNIISRAWDRDLFLPSTLYVLQLDEFIETGKEKWSAYNLTMNHMLMLPFEANETMYCMKTINGIDYLVKCFENTGDNEYVDIYPDGNVNITTILQTLNFNAWQCRIDEFASNFTVDNIVKHSETVKLIIYGDNISINGLGYNISNGVLKLLPINRAERISMKLTESSNKKYEFVAFEYTLDRMETK